MLENQITSGSIEWMMSNNCYKIRIQRFRKKVNYQDIDKNGRLVKGYWFLDGPYEVKTYFKISIYIGYNFIYDNHF